MTESKLIGEQLTDVTNSSVIVMIASICGSMNREFTELITFFSPVAKCGRLLVTIGSSVVYADSLDDLGVTKSRLYPDKGTCCILSEILCCIKACTLSLSTWIEGEA